ncbi:MAG TPA: hypothetical protein VK700_08730 [Steroidobacteraceae bacterium]|nr:hypothetical protein [Steroidobacteraceae bacterium]
MATTIIDHLVLELGLDPKQFNKGAASAAAEVKTVQDQISYSAGEMVSALQRVAAEFVSLFLVVGGVKDVVGLFGQLNEATRQLGIDSRNVGESAAELRDWGNIAEFAGGKAEDATGTIQGLQKSIFDYQRGFGWDEQLTNFLRLGVDTGAATGKMRDFHAILLDVAKTLQGMSGEDKFNWTQKLGLHGGIANAVTQGPEQLEAFYRRAQSIPQISGADTAAAQRLAVAFDTLKDRVEAWATKILTAVEPAIEGLFNAISTFLTGHQGGIGNGINDIAAWVASDGPKRAITALTEFAQAVADVFRFIDDFLHPVATTEKIVGGLGDLARLHNSGRARDQTVLREISAAEHKYHLPTGLIAKTGNGPDQLGPGSADPLAAILAQQHAALGGDKADPDWYKTVQAINARVKATAAPATQVPGASPNPDALKAHTGAIATPLAGLPKKDAPGTTTASKKPVGMVNNVTGDIFVQSQATDPNSLAGGINGALQRKLTVSQADGALH